MKAVMYGGGNIGRGFVGALLSQSGYRVTFIDVSESVVKHLREKQCYPIRYVYNGGYDDVLIENVTAVSGNDSEAVSDAIAQCDILATAVGVRVLKFIVPNIVAGLRKRWGRNAQPLNIIICENLMDANKVLEKMLKEYLSEQECIWFDRTVGLVEVSIGRMVPVQTEEMKDGEPMRVCVERYGFLPADKDAFKGAVPEIKNMIPYAPFDFYIKRKLYVHNMGHATCAYLGDLLGMEYIYQAVDMPDVRIIVQNAMLESAMALSQKYGASLNDLQMHITDLLGRFKNSALKDTCQRVGGDPTRKLSAGDRLIGAAKLAMDQGVTPAYIAVGAAAGIYRYIQEMDGACQDEATAQRVLAEVSGLDADAQLMPMILSMYRQILSGGSVTDLRRAADAVKMDSLQDVI